MIIHFIFGLLARKYFPRANEFHLVICWFSRLRKQTKKGKRIWKVEDFIRVLKWLSASNPCVLHLTRDSSALFYISFELDGIDF